MRRIGRLVDRVLEQASPPSGGALASSCAEPIVEWAEELLAERLGERGVRFERAVSGPLPRIALAEDALRQLLLNLLTNAVEASPPGACVRIEASADAANVVIRIRDEGPGVAPELRERIFEPFFSTKRERPGGLGLAISRRIAEGARGSLDVEPAAERGAVFRLVLPSAKAEPAGPQRP